jgi:hypothetical protein
MKKWTFRGLNPGPYTHNRCTGVLLAKHTRYHCAKRPYKELVGEMSGARGMSGSLLIVLKIYVQGFFEILLIHPPGGLWHQTPDNKQTAHHTHQPRLKSTDPKLLTQYACQEGQSGGTGHANTSDPADSNGE